MREPIINIAVQAARAAGNIIMRVMDRLDTVQVTEKKPNDYVTEIDHLAEREIISIIHKAYPTHGIIGEEGGESNPDNESVWIIDPLDGTRNYIHGFPHFCISIAHSFKGVIENGVIYDPIRQELFTATRGKGAQRNERRIRVSTRSLLNECLLGTGFPYRHAAEIQNAYSEALKALIPICGDLRRTGSAALDLAYVACGRLDAFWEVGLKQWDMAAGVLMIKEAGGLVTDIVGTEEHLKNGHVAAGNPKVLKQVLKIIHPHMARLLK